MASIAFSANNGTLPEGNWPAPVYFFPKMGYLIPVLDIRAV